MNIAGLQTAIGAVPDGQWGPASRAALLATFTNTVAPAITPGQQQAFADRLGVTLRQLAAVASVESSGSGFDRAGRPKILFERHVFHRLTDGRYSPSPFSNPERGGYNDDSWNKLLMAAGRNPDAAFSAVSWGKFQVLGEGWHGMNYTSAYALAAGTVTGEAAHYDLLCRFIEHNRLNDEMARLSPDPETCRAFARGYNGAAYAAGGYHRKLAEAMK